MAERKEMDNRQDNTVTTEGRSRFFKGHDMRKAGSQSKEETVKEVLRERWMR